jgi:hypothetical protein
METGSLGTKDIWDICPELEGEDMVLLDLLVDSSVMEHHLRLHLSEKWRKVDERSLKQEIVSFSLGS